MNNFREMNINCGICGLTIIYICAYYVVEIRRVKLIIFQEEYERILLKEEEYERITEDNERKNKEDNERRLNEEQKILIEYKKKKKLRMNEIENRQFIKAKLQLQEELNRQIKQKQDYIEERNKEEREEKEDLNEYNMLIMLMNQQEDAKMEETANQFKKDNRIRELQEEDYKQKMEEEYTNVVHKILLNMFGVIVVIVYFMMSLENMVD